MAYFDSNGYRLYEIYLSSSNNFKPQGNIGYNAAFFQTSNTSNKYLGDANNPIEKMIASNYPTLYDNIFDRTKDDVFNYSFIAGTNNDRDITWDIHLNMHSEFVHDTSQFVRFENSYVSKSYSDNTQIITDSFAAPSYSDIAIRIRIYGVVIIDTDKTPIAIGYCTIASSVMKSGNERNYTIMKFMGWSFIGCYTITTDDGTYPVIFTPPAERYLDNSSNTNINGGYGTGINPTDTIDVPTLPTFSFNSAGSQLYKLTSVQMTAFTNWLWSSDWQDNIKKIRTNPIENIIGIAVTDIDVSGTTQTIKLGNLETDVQAQAVNNWITIDCGSISLAEYYGSFADYEPFIATTLYLPKVGFVQIPADVCMNNTIKVVYNIELSSGEGLCFVHITNKRDGFSYVYNTYSCTVNGNIPLSASDHTQQLVASANFALNTTTAIASTVAGVPSNYNPLSGALNVATAKNPTTTTGRVGNMSAMMCVKKPYLLINRTVLTKPSTYQENNGYLINYTATINGHTGFLKTRDFHAEFNAPYNHKVEIERIMNEGVFING